MSDDKTAKIMEIAQKLHVLEEAYKKQQAKLLEELRELTNTQQAATAQAVAAPVVPLATAPHQRRKGRLPSGAIKSADIPGFICDIIKEQGPLMFTDLRKKLRGKGKCGGDRFKECLRRMTHSGQLRLGTKHYTDSTGKARFVRIYELPVSNIRPGLVRVRSSINRPDATQAATQGLSVAER